ncbi:MAG: glycosyltransferase family 9 protein [Bacteroidaceae bacterium]|nr:glycosyltransferase family 9 protein [Bacteroidaceae bacterium]
MKSLLLIRFSALGDILMTVPIVEALARQYPDMQITMVSRPFVASVFERLPQNVHFLGINPRNYHGLAGLEKMYKELKKLHPTYVCDLHDVLRTKYLRMRFKMAGVPTAHIVKDRKARKQFLTSEVKTQQETSFERYQKAIDRILQHAKNHSPQLSSKETGNTLQLSDSLSSFCDSKSSSRKMDGPAIGIAPFAAHQGKIYPLDLMEKVVSLFNRKGVHVYLFGAGDKEKALMEEWEQKYEHVESTVGKLGNMAAELDLIAQLDAMLTMDSGNMHLASLTSTPVYSIWGATHPLGGFLGWKQPMSRCIQKDLPCRPCSIFGNKPCQYGDFHCLNSITPEEIVESIVLPYNS